MHLVAILGAPAGEALLPALAGALGVGPYDLRLALNGGSPAVVQVSPDAARAQAAADAATALGCRAVAVDRDAVVPHHAMVAVRDFAFAGPTLVASALAPDRLPFDDVLAIVRATHRSVTRTVEVKEGRKFRPIAAIATGGLLLSKKTKEEVETTDVARQQVLYLFRRSGGVPWLLAERHARYAALGPDLSASSLGNLATMASRLRALAPHARYDERLVTPRDVRGVAEGADAADLLAHLIALA